MNDEDGGGMQSNRATANLRSTMFTDDNDFDDNKSVFSTRMSMASRRSNKNFRSRISEEDKACCGGPGAGRCSIF